MNFGAGFLLTFGFLFGLPLLLLLAQFIGWLTGKKEKPIRWTFAFLLLLPVAATFYLDVAGEARPVKVVGKDETIKLGQDGSWTRARSLSVESQAPGEDLPTRLGIGSDEETFDRLRVGDAAEVRVLEWGEHIKFARLKNRSTFSLLSRLVPRRPRGPWREGEAVVRQVTAVTRYSSRSGGYAIPWPFEIVQLDFAPEGGAGPVVAVDVIEAGSAEGLGQGARVRVSWPADDPRAARIVGARPGAPWANWFYGLGTALAFLAAVIALFSALGFIKQLRKRRRQAPAQ